MTGRICLKSPPRTTTLPPNGIFILPLLRCLHTSLKLLSTALKQCLCIIGASFHIISFARNIKSPKGLPGSMVHVEHSSTVNGMWNLEWVVLPPGIRSVAIPLEAIVKTIFLLDLNADDIALQMKVFNVPPYPYKKKQPRPICLYLSHDCVAYNSLFHSHCCHQTFVLLFQ